MCAEYQIRSKKTTLEAELGLAIKNISKQDEWDARIKMSLLAPVLGMKEGELRLNELIFPVNPFPNARLSQLRSHKTKVAVAEAEEEVVRIDAVPLWRAGFEKYPCVVPMTRFLEPAYWGKHQGEVLSFGDPDDRLLFVPAILVKPRVPSTGKLNGFSLLTHTASEQMLEFHHRLLVLLRAEDALEYLKLGAVPAQERYEFLLERRYLPTFKIETDRKMAKGWDKRVEHHKLALADEERYRSVLERESVRG